MSTLQIPRRGTLPGRVGSSALSAQSSGTTEMALPSISFGSSPVACKVRCPLPGQCDPTPSVRELSGSWISLLYLHVGLILGLTALAFPSGASVVAWLVCPVWSTAVVAHGLCGDNLLFVCAVIIALAYPIVVLMRDFQLYAGYLLLFSCFASRGFWRDQRGAWLIVCAICWCGVLAGACGLLIFENKPGILEAGAISGICLAVVCTRKLARFRYKIVIAGTVSP